MDIMTRRNRSERERIRAELLRRAPALRRRMVETPSGSLLIRSAGGEDLEIGRLPHHGRTSWVVVARRDGRAVVTGCESPARVVAASLSRLRAVPAA
jgi:hypothetical protein